MKKIIIPSLMLITLSACATPPAETAPPPAAGAPAQGEQAGPATAAPKKWVTVAKLTGSSDKRGEPFHLSGGDARLTYKVTDTSGMGAVIFAAYLVGKGESLEKSGGMPEVTVSAPGKDTTRLAKDKGDYYLDVQAANARWSVIVEEKR